MYMNDNGHRFPALVLAAGLTTAVVLGLSAIAHTGIATSAAKPPQVVATTPFVPQAAVAEARVAPPLRIDVVATRSRAQLQTVADGVRSKHPG
jgi:hypothetical protein